VDISEKISRLSANMKLKEMSDDGYYLSRQYKDDCRQLYALQKLLRKNE